MCAILTRYASLFFQASCDIGEIEIFTAPMIKYEQQHSGKVLSRTAQSGRRKAGTFEAIRLGKLAGKSPVDQVSNREPAKSRQFSLEFDIFRRDLRKCSDILCMKPHAIRCTIPPSSDSFEHILPLHLIFSKIISVQYLQLKGQLLTERFGLKPIWFLDTIPFRSLSPRRFRIE
jgi:hypothetical protein